MEPVSFAVGILGLAGLFNTCLDVLDRVDSWKNVESESETLDAQFEANKFRLKRWGQAVGLDVNSLPAKRDEIPNNDPTYIIVRKLLKAIEAIGAGDDDSSQTPGLRAEKERIGGRTSRRHSHSNNFPQSKKEKLRWALKDKAKRIIQVQQLSALVDNLEKLVPVNGETGRLSSHGESIGHNDPSLPHDDDLLKREAWQTEFERILKKLEREMEAETRRDLQVWLLGSYIPNDDYEKRVRERTESTCRWIMNRPSFLGWSSPEFPAQRAKILWVHGPAGFGKSVLCASVVDHLSSTQKTPVAYFFFSGHSQNGDDLFVAVRSWLVLMMSHVAAFDLIEEKRVSQGGLKATNSDILDLLRRIINEIPGCTLILDGLDECRLLNGNQSAGEYGDITTFMEALEKTTKGTQTHIMIVSRDEPEIRTCLATAVKTHSIIEHKITPEDVYSDVVSYSRHIVSQRLSTKPDKFKEEISQQLADRCGGQFLWIRLQESALRSGRNQKVLERAIQNTPKGLEQTYEKNWQWIKQLPEEDQERAISLLRWVVFALRPLTVGEVAEAILIDQHCDEVHIDELPDSIDEDYINSELSFYCGSLLEVHSPTGKSESATRIVQLTHFSVKEFLIHKIHAESSILELNRRIEPFIEQAQNTVIAKLCLRYIHFPQAWQRGSQPFGEFLPYAARYWHRHTTLGDQGDAALLVLVSELFDVANPSWASWKSWFDENENATIKGGVRIRLSSTSPIYYAAHLGLNETVKILVHDRKHYIDERGSLGHTALAAACKRGNLNVVKTLIMSGANFEIPTNDGSTPLKLASSNGRVGVVKLLLETGADVKAAGNDGRTPVYTASQNGHFEVVKLLLEHGADITVTTNDGWTPVSAASRYGHFEIVKFLIENGADISVSGKYGWTPVNRACEQGYFDVVQLLLEKGADITVPTDYERAPVYTASQNGHFRVVKLLLEHGADITVTTDDGWTPVSAASRYGHFEVVKLLLEHGADISVSGIYRWTPVNRACEQGYFDVVQLLLKKGADITVPTDDGWTPVSVASRYGHFEVVKLLLEHGANITVTTDNGWTPVSIASRYGHFEIVKFLIENGADISVSGKYGWTPVNRACEQGYFNVVQLLLEKGADITVPTDDGWTPVSVASRYGHFEVVKLLLEHGADITVSTDYGWTPVSIASRYGNFEVVKLLLEHGADITATTNDGWTPVYHASRYGHFEVVKLLLENGADITVTTNDGWTPVSLASENGHLEVVKLLLEHGANMTVANNDGYIPINVGSGQSHPELVEPVLEKVVCVNART